jgi:hypothetical protein
MRRLVQVDTLDPQESRDQETRNQTPAPGHMFDPWRFREEVDLHGADLTGYKVEAADGSIGKVDEASHAVEGAYLVVDTGPWIFGKKVMLPAGLVRDIDPDTETIFVDLAKDEIKNAPEFDETTYRDQSYRNELGSYYSGRGTSGTT